MRGRRMPATDVEEAKPKSSIDLGALDKTVQQYIRVTKYPTDKTKIAHVKYAELIIIDENTRISPKLSYLETQYIKKLNYAGLIIVAVGMIILPLTRPLSTMFMIAAALIAIGCLIVFSGKKESIIVGEPIFICHHCGKPISEVETVIIKIEDEFPEYRIEIRGTKKRIKHIGNYYGAHCIECLRKYHPEAYSKISKGGMIAMKKAMSKQIKTFRSSFGSY